MFKEVKQVTQVLNGVVYTYCMWGLPVVDKIILCRYSYKISLQHEY